MSCLCSCARAGQVLCASAGQVLCARAGQVLRASAGQVLCASVLGKGCVLVPLQRSPYVVPLQQCASAGQGKERLAIVIQRQNV